MKSIAIIAFAAQALPTVLAICCGGGHICADGAAPTPCCATKPCNIFCCACDGECRVASGGRLLLERDPGQDAFALADSGGNGNLTLNQYLEYMGIDGQDEMWNDWFNKHDKNGDGVITEDEIGSS